MSKNVKFLRKGVLFLAVLAMVIGQCFGVFGAVAEAAGSDDYKVISVAWDETVPATLVKGVDYKLSATAVLEARKNVAETTYNDLIELVLGENGVDFYYTEAQTVTVPATYKGDQVTINFEVKVPTAQTFSDTWYIKLQAEQVDNYKPETAAQKYTVTEGPDAFDFEYADADDATKVYVTYADKYTGQKISTPNAVDFGDALTATHGIFLTLIDANNEHKLVDVDTTLTVKNTNTGVTFNVDVVDGIAEMTDIAVNSANFDAGVNTLLITNNLGLARTYMTVIVNPEVPTVTLTGADAQLVWDEVSEGKEYIALGVGSYRNNDDRQKVYLKAAVTTDWFNFYGQGDATIRANKADTVDGYVEFYDNGELVGTVALGKFVDNIPYTTNHTKDNWAGQTVAADEAAITFIVDEAGNHVYSAKFVPANEAAKVLTEAASNKLDATYAVYEPTTVKLTWAPEVILRNDVVTFTLTFNKAPGFGEAAFYLYNWETSHDDVNTIHFELNDTDLVYTDTQKLTELGEYDIDSLTWKDACVSFDMDEPVYIFNTDCDKFVGDDEVWDYTQWPQKADEFELKLNNEYIYVYEEYTYTTITAEPAQVYFGEDIVLTAKTVDENGDPMVEGDLEFWAIYPNEVYDFLDSIDLADVKANENPKDWGTFTYTVEDLKDWGIIGFEAYYVPTSDCYYAPSFDQVAAGLIHEQGELKVIEKSATINNQDTEADLAWFKVALIDEATGEIATDVSTGEVRMSFIDGFNTDMIDAFKGYITDGIATIYVENEVLADLEMGNHAVQFALYDCSYVAEDIKDVITILDYDLIPTNLKVFYNKTAKEITVQVWDEIESGRLYQATGWFEITVGGEKIASTDDFEGDEWYADSDDKGSITVKLPVIGLSVGEDKDIEVTYFGDMKYAGSTAVLEDAVDIAKIALPLKDKLFEVTAEGNVLTIELVSYNAGETIGKVEAVPAMMAILDAAAELLGNKAWTEASFEIYAGDKLLDTIELAAGDLTKVYTYTVDAAMGFDGEQEITVVLTANFVEGQTEVVTVVIPEFKTTGWYQADNGDWYLFDENGELVTGWVKSGAYWYYLDETTGIMATGFQTLAWDGVENTYYFDEINGNMKTGWQKIDGEWYLFNASGEELFGWQKMGGAWYYLDEATGIMLTGFQTLEWDGVEATYYLNDLNGNMQTGWIDVDGVWYYAYANGTIATNTTIGNWTAGDDGIFTEIA